MLIKLNGKKQQDDPVGTYNNDRQSLTQNILDRLNQTYRPSCDPHGEVFYTSPVSQDAGTEAQLQGPHQQTNYVEPSAHHDSAFTRTPQMSEYEAALYGAEQETFASSWHQDIEVAPPENLGAEGDNALPLEPNQQPFAAIESELREAWLVGATLDAARMSPVGAALDAALVERSESCRAEEPTEEGDGALIVDLGRTMEINDFLAKTARTPRGTIEFVRLPGGRKITPLYNRCGIMTGVEFSDGVKIIKSDGEFPWLVLDADGQPVEELKIKYLTFDRLGNLIYTTAEGEKTTLKTDGTVLTEPARKNVRPGV
jgi:hypothetical protein